MRSLRFSKPNLLCHSWCNSWEPNPPTESKKWKKSWRSGVSHPLHHPTHEVSLLLMVHRQSNWYESNLIELVLRFHWDFNWLETGFLNHQQYMGVSENRGGPPKSSILIRLSIIFTIHFGGFSPYFWFNSHMNWHVFTIFTSHASKKKIGVVFKKWRNDHQLLMCKWKISYGFIIRVCRNVNWNDTPNMHETGAFMSRPKIPGSLDPCCPGTSGFETNWVWWFRYHSSGDWATRDRDP